MLQAGSRTRWAVAVVGLGGGTEAGGEVAERFPVASVGALVRLFFPHLHPLPETVETPSTAAWYRAGLFVCQPMNGGPCQFNTNRNLQFGVR